MVVKRGVMHCFEVGFGAAPLVALSAASNNRTPNIGFFPKPSRNGQEKWDSQGQKARSWRGQLLGLQCVHLQEQRGGFQMSHV